MKYCKVFLLAPALALLPSIALAQRSALCDSTILVDKDLASEINVHTDLTEWIKPFGHADLLFKKPELKNRNSVSRDMVRAYPRKLRDSGIGGEPTFAIWVDTAGVVKKRTLIQPSGYADMDEAADGVISKMRFDPQRVDSGCAVPMVLRMPIVLRTIP